MTAIYIFSLAMFSIPQTVLIFFFIFQKQEKITHLW